MTTRTPFVGGNWKMNTDAATGVALAEAVHEATAGHQDAVQIAVFPPFPYLHAVGKALSGSKIHVGAQDCYHEANGAFTGEVSLAMLKDVGVSVVLTGHSERRHVIGETDELVNHKTKAALDAGMHVILAIGEQLSEREAGQTDAVNERQLKAGLAGVTDADMARVTIAYEPVWAIGTGKTASPEDAQDAHAKCRAVLAGLYSDAVAQATRIQYGGSMKPGNAPELMAQPDIDGGLIGGASLKAPDFAGIVAAAAGA